jgi:hypothetical protein
VIAVTIADTDRHVFLSLPQPAARLGRRKPGMRCEIYWNWAYSGAYADGYDRRTGAEHSFLHSKRPFAYSVGWLENVGLAAVIEAC